MDTATETGIDAAKTASKRVVQQTCYVQRLMKCLDLLLKYG